MNSADYRSNIEDLIYMENSVFTESLVFFLVWYLHVRNDVRVMTSMGS